MPAVRSFGAYWDLHRLTIAKPKSRPRLRLIANSILFSGEQHGFRKAANIQRSLDAELHFYAVEVFKISLTF